MHIVQRERLNRQARNVRLTTSSRTYLKRGKSPELSLPQVCGLSIAEAAEFFESLKLDPTSQLIAEEALKEIRGRLGFLMQCGLHYLSLDRSAPHSAVVNLSEFVWPVRSAAVSSGCLYSRRTIHRAAPARQHNVTGKPAAAS